MARRGFSRAAPGLVHTSYEASQETHLLFVVMEGHGGSLKLLPTGIWNSLWVLFISHLVNIPQNRSGTFTRQSLDESGLLPRLRSLTYSSHLAGEYLGGLYLGFGGPIADSLLHADLDSHGSATLRFDC